MNTSPPIMPTIPLVGALAALREAEVRLLTDVADAIVDLADQSSDDRRRLLDVADDLRQMFFLIVVIGEFNAGKSSFINALLGDELLPMGITPTTEMIELIRYNETPLRRPEIQGDSIRQWAHPATGAPGVALVDTPGTGSVFQKHERTAKDFLHRSDLVIFVISAKRAFGETERLYLDLARSYGKKIIVVMNQIDLLTPNERAEVRRFVERQLDELLGVRPLLFMVSARESLNARKTGLAPDPEKGGEGVDAVRAHLRGVIAAAPPARQKLLAQLDMTERMIRKYADSVTGRAALVTSDTTRVREVEKEMERQSAGLQSQLVGARQQIDTVFDGLRLRGMAFITDHLSPRRLLRPISREGLQTEFQEIVVGRSLREVTAASASYVNALVDHSRSYWRSIIERLNQLRDLMEQEFAGLDASIYAEQREALEDAIRIAEAELRSYSTGQVVDDLDGMFRTNMSNLATSAIASFIGVVVAVLGVAAPGGLVGLAGLAFFVGAPIAVGGGVLAFRYYRRVQRESKRELDNRITQVQQAYHTALDDLTQKERARLTSYGKQVLSPFFSRLEVLTQKYASQQADLDAALSRVDTLRRGIEDL